MKGWLISNLSVYGIKLIYNNDISITKSRLSSTFYFTVRTASSLVFVVFRHQCFQTCLLQKYQLLIPETDILNFSTVNDATLSGIVYIVLGRQADILEYRIVLFFHSCFDHNTHHNNRQQQPRFRSLRNIFFAPWCGMHHHHSRSEEYGERSPEVESTQKR